MLKLKFNIFLALLLFSCSDFNKDKSKYIAKFNDHILYKKELIKLIDTNDSQDSILIANKIINDWAIEKILIEKAKLNLPEKDLDIFDKLVDNYKSELYSTAYLDALINSSVNVELDTIEIEGFYKKNIDLFKLKDNIFKLVYVKISEDFSDIIEIRNRLRNFKNNETYLDSISFRFIDFSYDFNNWKTQNELIKIFPFLNTQKINSLKNYSFLQIKDSLNLYLIRVLDYKKIGSYAPIDFVFPTLEYMSINNRRKNLKQSIKTDLIKNAIQNNELEIF